MSSALHGALRLFIPGARGSFIFDRQQPVPPSRPERLNLYIHLPFCSTICPFCPYVKEVHDPAVSAAYQDAILKELEGYRRLWGDVTVDTVYFGGGTPSLTPEIVEGTLSWLAGHFHLGHEVGVELHPSTAGSTVLRSLKNSGVSMASLGVQTFNDRLLGVLGRDYDGNLARQACERVLDVGFATTDVDLMFAIPTQNREEADADIGIACSLGVEQISTYPLISFSYTALGSHLHRKGVSMPPWWVERQMLGAVVTRARNAGYERTSIWSFNKPGTSRYTTVTRDAFVGIGAGATSRMGDYFWLNTFSVGEYIRSMEKGSPLSLATRLNAGDKMAYRLFWQCYDLAIDIDAFRHLLGRDLPHRVRALLPVLNLLGIARRQDSTIRVTDRGAYLFHLVEKEYTQAYLRTLWEACLNEAWPGRVEL